MYYFVQRTFKARYHFSKFLLILSFSVLFSSFCSLYAASYEMEHVTSPRTTGEISLQDRVNTSSSYDNTVFDLNYGSGLLANESAQQAFDAAAQLWGNFLLDPVTVKLDLDFADLSPGVLGSTSSVILYGDFDQVRDMVASNASETNNQREAALLPNLPTYDQFEAYGPSGFALDGNMTISQANYHALGGNDPSFNTSDGSITFSNNFSWDFDPSDGIDSGKFDFVGIAAHEIGHALGFISDVDYVDWVLDSGLVSDQVEPTPLDLFRFEKQDILDENGVLKEDVDFTAAIRDMTPGGEDVFYFGDGFAELSTGAYNGDGRQASHWKDSLGIGLMDPTAAPGELLSFTQNDFIAMDLIGWEINWDAAGNYLGFSVPEPASILLLAIGFVVTRKRKYS